MNKIGLILSREYLVRVRKKSFIIMTFIGPILFGGITIVPIWLSKEAIEERVVYIKDDSGLFKGKFKDSDNTRYVFTEANLEEAKENVDRHVTPNLLYIPAIDIDQPKGVAFFSNSNPSFSLVNDLKNVLRDVIEEIKLDRSGLDKQVIENLKVSLDISTINLREGKETESNVGVATVVGYLGAFMTYFFIFYYGTQILRGVIEEKTNRIIEVIVSSVKPFQLMMGKILGIGFVGLTQFVLWVILTAAVSSGIFYAFGITKSDPGNQINQTMDIQDAEAIAAANSKSSEMFQAILSQDYTLIVFAFAFYFLGGFFLYGSLFAAVGSAIDHESDAQQFMLPITIPLIFSIIALTAVLNEPNGSLAFWLSVIPFTSPVVMMMRIPFEVPLWELLLSMVSLLAGFIFTTWIAGRIYRIGILIYGTKVNYKTLAKWFFVKS
ncbi:MAG: ABC transporter permease [Bacteroidetes bacterium]|nr:ABC transporter permease [Bacteroidota bacterium]MDA1119209.1 ABC transporter permease [Bacteroidota bacterium]